MGRGASIAASAVPVLRDARPAASLLRTRAERRLRKIESKRTPPHGEEGRAATRLEPWAAGASIAASAVPVLRDARPAASLLRTRPERRLRKIESKRTPPHGEERRAATRLEPWAAGASIAASAVPVLRDARPAASLLRLRPEQRLRKIESKRTPPHGEERRAATRLEPWAAGASIAASAVPVLRDARPAASLLRTRAERRLRKIESKRTPPHGEERRAATRLEPWAAGASIAASAAPILRDARPAASLLRMRPEQRLRKIESKRTPPHGEERRAATRLEPWAAGASIAASAVPVLRDARPAASLLRTRAERRLRNIESKRTPPHGEERRAATRLEPWAMGASIAAAAAPVLRDAR